MYLSVFSPNTGKYEPEKLRIGTLFTQCGCRSIQAFVSFPKTKNLALAVKNYAKTYIKVFCLIFLLSSKYFLKYCEYVFIQEDL